MDLVEGQSLDKIIKKSFLKKEALLNLVGQLIKGILFLSSNGLCHGDLFPRNIMIDKNGIVKIIDLTSIFTMTNHSYRLNSTIYPVFKRNDCCQDWNELVHSLFLIARK